MEISIPADDAGYVLLQCPKCGEKFKLTPTDIESDEVEDIYCPLCGLTSESFWTDDGFELAQAKMLNQFMGNLQKELKALERKTRNSMMQIKAGKYKEEDEIPINSTVDPMEIVQLDCCNRSAKIRYLLSYSGYYCPFCGGLRDGDNES